MTPSYALPNKAATAVQIQTSASPEEAAAIVAAVEQFVAETTPAAPPAGRPNPWQRAALLEGISARSPRMHAWGESEPWGAR